MTESNELINIGVLIVEQFSAGNKILPDITIMNVHGIPLTFVVIRQNVSIFAVLFSLIK